MTQDPKPALFINDGWIAPEDIPEIEARLSADGVEINGMAPGDYDAAKSAGRIARAKSAHDDILSRVYRAQADALSIEARAKRRLADEYDAAQARGEVMGRSRTCVGDDNAPATAADLGLRRDQIHEARQIRDAEAEDPGVFERRRDIVAAKVDAIGAALFMDALGARMGALGPVKPPLWLMEMVCREIEEAARPPGG